MPLCLRVPVLLQSERSLTVVVMDIDVREVAEEHLDGLGPGYVDVEPVVLMAPIRFDDSVHKKILTSFKTPSLNSEKRSALDMYWNRCLVMPTFP